MFRRSRAKAVLMEVRDTYLVQFDLLFLSEIAITVLKIFENHSLQRLIELPRYDYGAYNLLYAYDHLLL